MSRAVRCTPVPGERGAIAAGHPLAASAGETIFDAGGNAVDAAIAAQAVICVVMPHAAGLGGDMLALVARGGHVTAVDGAGRSPAATSAVYAANGGSSVTVPGLVDAWLRVHETYGSLPLGDVLSPAVTIATDGLTVDASLAAAADAQRSRLEEGGASNWALLGHREGETWRQPELARLLQEIARSGRGAFYAGTAARAIATAVQNHGGCLTASDLTSHVTAMAPALEIAWGDQLLAVQPPPSQGVLLGMAARWLDDWDGSAHSCRQHVLVEATEAVFEFRDSVSRGSDLLDEELDIDVDHAARRGGPRAYLHTAGVATADSAGTVVSSLVSVFDDFGSGVFVPDLGIVLNNRAGGFTSGLNSPGPSKRPVHTLAPALVCSLDGDLLALATPGADGQIQTLLQMLDRLRFGGETLRDAIAAPRWRSEDGRLLVESDHDQLEELQHRGHHVSTRPSGGEIFGGIVAAGTKAGVPFAASDWRRHVTTGAR